MMKSLLTHFGFNRAFTGVTGIVTKTKFISSRQDYTLNAESYQA